MTAGRNRPQVPRRVAMADIDEYKLNELIGKMLGDLGGAFSVPTVRLGFRLGLFDALHQVGPATSDELAKRSGGLAPRSIRQLIIAQADNRIIIYNTQDWRIIPTPKQGIN